MLKEMAIEQDRCVMERHKEALEINERYVSLIKESCKQNACYCEPPCEMADQVSVRSFATVIAQARNRRKEEN